MIGLRLFVLATLVTLTVFFLRNPAVAADPAEVKKRIEQVYGVEVLQISRIERKKQSFYAVRVLSLGPDQDNAWQVNELLVDPKTGRLVSVFQHGTSGYGFDGPINGGGASKSPHPLIRVPLPEYKRSIKVLGPKATKDKGAQKPPSNSSGGPS